MDLSYRGKTKVCLNGKFIGRANHVSMDKKDGEVIVNITIDNDIRTKKGNLVSKEENYNEFFNKFSKAFRKQ